MNLDMIQPQKSEDFLLSTTKNGKKLIKQTHRKAETLEFELTKPRETISFKPSITLGLGSDCMIGLKSVEVYNSSFNITEENDKFELYTNSSEEISFFKLKDKVAEALGLSDISPEDLENELYGPDFTKTYRILLIEKSQTDDYYILILRYGHSPLWDFESYLRFLTGINEVDIQIFLT